MNGVIASGFLNGVDFSMAWQSFCQPRMGIADRVALTGRVSGVVLRNADALWKEEHRSAFRAAAIGARAIEAAGDCLSLYEGYVRGRIPAHEAVERGILASVFGLGGAVSPKESKTALSLAEGCCKSGAIAACLKLFGMRSSGAQHADIQTDPTPQEEERPWQNRLEERVVEEAAEASDGEYLEEDSSPALLPTDYFLSLSRERRGLVERLRPFAMMLGLSPVQDLPQLDPYRDGVTCEVPVAMPVLRIRGEKEVYAMGTLIEILSRADEEGIPARSPMTRREFSGEDVEILNCAGAHIALHSMMERLRQEEPRLRELAQAELDSWRQ